LTLAPEPVIVVPLTAGEDPTDKLLPVIVPALTVPEKVPEEAVIAPAFDTLKGAAPKVEAPDHMLPLESMCQLVAPLPMSMLPAVTVPRFDVMLDSDVTPILAAVTVPLTNKLPSMTTPGLSQDDTPSQYFVPANDDPLLIVTVSPATFVLLPVNANMAALAVASDQEPPDV
jgi:hypothetical protein